MADSKPVLYSYWRSSCSWRVRIALALKKVEYEYKAVHLVKDGGEQHKEGYKTINPMGQVPAFEFDGKNFTQSMAIMELLEEYYQNCCKILPSDPFERAKVREICEVINSGTQPIQNLSVMKKHSSDQAERNEWSRFWIEKGLRGVEAKLEKHSGKYCVGDTITMADCCLIPQVYNANRFAVSMEHFHNINRIVACLEQHEAFIAAHPDSQPDAQ